MKTVIKFNSITKKFGKIIANDNINFSIMENEVHAILGENGAGKSTLMSILFGLYKPTSGSIEVYGEVQKIKSAKDANRLKISMLPQHFKLVENMTVLENIILGYENTYKSFFNKIGYQESYNRYLNKKVSKKIIEKTKEKYNISIDLNSKVSQLSVSDKQKVELLKILWVESQIIIFDEPTSILTPTEIKNFINLVKNLKKSGKTIIIITHKLHEIKEMADIVSVMRKGKYISSHVVKKVSEREMAELMVGKSVDLNLSTFTKKEFIREVPVIEIKDLNLKPKENSKGLKNINLKIYPGEIVGIAAIEGNGQSELLKVISGLSKPSSGKIFIEEVDVTNASPKKHYYNYLKGSKKKEEIEQKRIDFIEEVKNEYLEAKKQSATKDELLKSKIRYEEISKIYNKPLSLISHIPEDRQSNGIILDFSVSENLILQDLKYFSNVFSVLQKKDVKSKLEWLTKQYDIRGIQSHKTKIRDLSGGNQQKIILGREIERSSSLLLAANPTRGLDVGAIRNVYKNIIETRNKGTAIILMSGEMDEIMQISDRIIIMHNGEIVKEFLPGKYTKTQIGEIMSNGILEMEKTINKKPTIKKKIVKKKSATKKKVIKKGGNK